MTFMGSRLPDTNGIPCYHTSPNHRVDSANSLLSLCVIFRSVSVCAYLHADTSFIYDDADVCSVSGPRILPARVVLARATIPTNPTEPFILCAFNLGSGYTQ